MGKFLQFLGILWAFMGGLNLYLMPWSTASNALLTFGLMLNFLLFIFPGLGLYALGAMMVRKAS